MLYIFLFIEAINFSVEETEETHNASKACTCSDDRLTSMRPKPEFKTLLKTLKVGKIYNTISTKTLKTKKNVRKARKNAFYTFPLMAESDFAFDKKEEVLGKIYPELLQQFKKGVKDFHKEKRECENILKPVFDASKKFDKKGKHYWKTYKKEVCSL